MSEEKRNKIGALWLKESKTTGIKYMSGEVEIDGVKHNIAVFKNKHKEQKTHPDYIILPQTDYKKPAPKKEHPAVTAIKETFGGEDIAEDDIPF